VDDPLTWLDGFLAEESAAERTVIGALAYDLRHWTLPRRAGGPRGHLPVIALRSYAEISSFDHRRGIWLSPPGDLPSAPIGDVVVAEPVASIDRATYGALFGRVAEWIAAGDVYQINLSFGFESAIEGDPAALYDRLAARSPAPYGAYLDFGDFQILSNSPELFLARRGRRLVTRPIKGTRPRGASADEDERLRRELAADAKERAEHVMIVDLERSDLGRVAEIGSVAVDLFESVETYATLHHLESEVCADLPPGVRFSEVLRATFPGGSITGAPKLRATQIIDELEPRERGFYTGAILHHPPDGDFTMSLAIRTATVHRGRARYLAGGGLVVDSTAESEYQECLLKAQAFFAAARGRDGA
jgi:para-aminobenzoate synthetase component 1